MTKSVQDVFSDFLSENLMYGHRYEQACAVCAPLDAVRGEMKALSVEKLQAALSGKDDSTLDTRLAKLAQREQEIMAEQIRMPRFHCEACGDTGMRGGGYCTCLLDRVYVQCYGAVDIGSIPYGFGDFDLNAFDDKKEVLGGKTQRQLAALYLKRAQEYIGNFPDTKRKNILITGKTGLGKSYLLNCMAKAAKAREIDTMLIRAGELFGVFFAHRMGEEADLSYLHGAKLLLIDDIGTEPVTNNVSVEYFYDLISRRLEQGLHTVFSTNNDDLHKRYDDRIASRLYSKEDSMMFYFSGQDLRVK